MAEVGPSLRHTLYLHYLCPYAARALYSAAFKGLPVEVVEVDLEHKADWHLAMNPAGTSPTLKVAKAGSDYILTESLPIVEYFNSFPGPNLYPLKTSGDICPLGKAIVDSHTKILADPLGPSLAPFYSRTATPEEVAKAKATVGKVNSYIKGGRHILHTQVGEDMVTLADVALLPFLERVISFRETLFQPVFEGEDFGPLMAWFEGIMATPWAASQRVNTHRLANVYKLMREGTYHGLALPATKYD